MLQARAAKSAVASTLEVWRLRAGHYLCCTHRLCTLLCLKLQEKIVSKKKRKAASAQTSQVNTCACCCVQSCQSWHTAVHSAGHIRSMFSSSTLAMQDCGDTVAIKSQPDSTVKQVSCTLKLLYTFLMLQPHELAYVVSQQRNPEINSVSISTNINFRLIGDITGASQSQETKEGQGCDCSSSYYSSSS